jgi:ubiquitin C-terminal hydrolase
MLDGGTIFILDATKRPIESEVLLVNSIPFKVVIQTRHPGRPPLVVRTYPTWSEKVLTGVINLSIFNPSTHENLTLELQLDYNMNEGGQCTAPHPLKFPNNPALDRFIAEGKVGISLIFQPREKKTCSTLWNDTARTDGPALVQRAEQYRPSNRQRFGIVGLRNLGASCYLNSVLQSLFHCPAFRRLIYSLDARTLPFVDRENVVLNLQILFRDMQTSPRDCNPDALMTSFGFRREQRHEQQDATEMWVVLVDNLRQKFNGSIRDQFTELFFSRIQTVKSNEAVGFYAAQEEQEYSSITVYLEGCKSISDCIQAYLSPAYVDDYKIEGTDEQGVLLQKQFLVASDVLAIHLARWEFDIGSERFRKLNQAIDFDDFLQVPVAGEKVLYTLHAIFVHEGQMGGGHYFVYVRPTTLDVWFDISDVSIQQATWETVKSRAALNAYFMLYARMDRDEYLYLAVQDEEVPPAVHEAATTAELEFTEITIVTRDLIAENAAQMRPGFRSDKALQIEIGKSWSVSKLYEQMHEQFGMAKESFRLWQCDFDGRPTKFLAASEGSVLSSLRDCRCLYVEDARYEDVGDNQFLVFLKLFSAAEATVSLKVDGLVGADMTIDGIAATVQAPFGHPATTQYDVFRERSSGDAELLSPTTVMSDKRLGCGTILVFQAKADRYVAPPVDYASVWFEEGADRADGSYTYFLRAKQQTIEARVGLFSMPEDDICIIRYPSDLTLTDLKTFIAPRLGVVWNPQQNSLFLFYATRGSLSFMGKNNENRQPLSDREPARIMVHFTDAHAEDAVKDWKIFLIHIAHDHVNVDTSICVASPRDTSIGDVIDANGAAVPNGCLSSMNWDRIGKPVTRDMLLRDLDGDLRIDQLPPDWEVNEMRLTPVWVSAGSGPEALKPMAFYIDLRPGETISQIRARIFRIIPDGETAKLRLELEWKEPTKGRHTEKFTLWDVADLIREFVVIRPSGEFRQSGGGIRITN